MRAREEEAGGKGKAGEKGVSKTDKASVFVGKSWRSS